MALPKITHPTFAIEIPSTKKPVTCRSMLSREEKILLMAKQSDQDTDKLHAIKQVVNNCIIDGLDIDKLSIFDLEYLFLKIRSQSVSNKTKVNYRDHGDDKVYEFEINLDEVKVWWPEEDSKGSVPVNDRVVIKLKYPPASLYNDLAIIGKGDEEALTLLVARCIEAVYDGDNVTPADQVPEKEMVEFLDNLDVKTYGKIREFIANVPHLEYVITYKNSNNDDRRISLTSLDDFFTF